MITIAAPNHLHAPITIDAAAAGKHVIVREADGDDARPSATR